MRVTIVTLSAMLMLLISGCDKSPAPPSTVAPLTNVTAQSNSPAEESTAAAKEAPAKEAPTKEAPAKEAPAKESPTPQNELIAGIKNPFLESQFEAIQKEAAEKPTDVAIQLKYIRVLQTLGQQRIRAKETEKVYATFAAAGDVARQLMANRVEVPPEMHPVLAEALYNDACAASRAKKTKESLESLEQAVNYGFADFALLESDEDLLSIRDSAELKQKIAEWKKAAQERAIQHAQEELAAGESFPFDFTLTDVDGKPIKLADYKGKVVIVDIWGTWCPPCRAEIPSFIKLQDSFADKGFQMIGLNKENQTGDEGNKLVKEFMEQNKMNYPCALVDDATQDQVTDFQGYPTTLFLDRTGKVRLKAVGLHEYAFLEAIVQVLLDEPAPAATPAASPAAAAPPAASAPAAPAPAGEPAKKS